MSKRSRQQDAQQYASPEQQYASPEMSGDTTASNEDRERIERRAYELYLARGGEHGRADEDWLTAERECRNGSTREES